jgi:hypothetical protein
MSHAPTVGAAEFQDATGRTVTVPDRVERVLASGPTAAVVLYALAPEKMIGWPSAPRPNEFILPVVRDLAEFGLRAIGAPQDVVTACACRRGKHTCVYRKTAAALHHHVSRSSVSVRTRRSRRQRALALSDQCTDRRGRADRMKPDHATESRTRAWKVPRRDECRAAGRQGAARSETRST